VFQWKRRSHTSSTKRGNFRWNGIGRKSKTGWPFEKKGVIRPPKPFQKKPFKGFLTPIETFPKGKVGKKEPKRSPLTFGKFKPVPSNLPWKNGTPTFLFQTGFSRWNLN